MSRILRSRRGYTLLELMMSLIFVSIVLIGMYNVFSTLANMQGEALRKGTVASWTSASIASMSKEIEDASVLYFPNAATLQTTAILGCSNWSTIQGGLGVGATMDPTVATTFFYYCYDTSTPVFYLRRLSATSATPAPAGFCPVMGGATTPANYAAKCIKGGVLSAVGTQSNEVMATDVNFLAPGGVVNTYLFSYNAKSPGGGVNVVMDIGNPNPWNVTNQAGVSATNSPQRVVNPQTATVNTTIALDRSYLNASD